MLGVLRSLRDTIKRFGMVSQPLTENAVVDTKIVTIPMTRKFFVGETVVIRNDTHGEVRVIDKIIDENTIQLTENLVRTWTTAENSYFEKAPGGQYLKRIYLGEPDVIPDFPAITITGDSRDENWWTINSTTVKWNCTISCIFQDDGLENTYENMMIFTKTIESSLWANRWPIFGILIETDVTEDAHTDDDVITVASTAGMQPHHQFIMEDYTATHAGEILRVIDDTHVKIRLTCPLDFLVANEAKFIIPSRWVMWSYPSGTKYGYIHKGTLLKASQISWFAQEEVVRFNAYTGPAKL